MTSPAKIRYCSIAAVCLLIACVTQASGEDKHDRSVSFRVAESQATYPLSINEAGTVTGYYITNSGVTRGFVRDEDGDITTFHVPGSVLTKPVGINSAGDITGYYELFSADTLLADVPQGFVRRADGKITTFGNLIDTSSSSSFWPQPVSINAAGEVVGNFPFITLSSFIFLRSPKGDVQTFTLSDGAEYSTVVTDLNGSGVIVGYSSSGSISQAGGFLWDGQGPLPSPVNSAGTVGIDVTGSTGTFPTAINADETVVGCYSENGLYYDFVRYHDGVIKTLDIPGTIPGCIADVGAGVYNVDPRSITLNDRGTVIGYYTNAAKVSKGFIHLQDGKLETFHHPGSKQTIPTGINDCDVITGYYSRGSEILGFVREP